MDKIFRFPLTEGAGVTACNMRPINFDIKDNIPCVWAEVDLSSQEESWVVRKIHVPFPSDQKFKVILDECSVVCGVTYEGKKYYAWVLEPRTLRGEKEYIFRMCYTGGEPLEMGFYVSTIYLDPEKKDLMHFYCRVS